MFIAANRYRRNSLQYNAGGLQVDDQNKFQQYDAAGAQLWAAYQQWVAQSKHARNTEAGWATF